MRFTSWLRSLKSLVGRVQSTPTERRQRPEKRCQLLTLEILESRLAPATLTVTSGGDAGPNTLRAALAAANSGDVIDFAATIRTIDLTSAGLTIATNVTIQNDLGVGPVTIDGDDQFTVFTVNSGVTTMLSGLTIQDGFATYSFDGRSKGGGILNWGTLTVSNSTLSDNTALIGFGLGAGICNEGGCNVLDSVLSDNSSIVGGAIENDIGATLTVSDSTLSDNTARQGGGAIDNIGILTVSNSTVADNSTAAGFLGGGIYSGGPLSFNVGATLNNTIVAGNTSSSDLFGFFTSGSNDLIGDGSYLSSFSDSLAGNPLLAPLGNYGGPTQTMALLPGSPAIDAGSNSLAVDASGNPLTTDKRGKSRIFGASVDIGAFESQGFAISVTSGSNQSTPVNTTFAESLTVSVTANSDLEPVNGGVVTFVAPSSGASVALSADQAVIGGGSASVTATANGSAGSYTVTAAVSGASTPASFALTNVPAIPPGTFAVTSTADSGPGSLRQAILDADAYNGTASITFDITAASDAAGGGTGYNSTTGVAVITPASVLPTITEPVVLDATTQPGYGGHPLIELDGADAGAGVSGLNITCGDSTVTGLDIGGFSGDGIGLVTNGGNVVKGDYIGTDATGTNALANGGDGVYIVGGSTDNTIGGVSSGARNVISGNAGAGVNIGGETDSGSSGNVIEGNYIGADATGTAVLGNSLGVYIFGDNNNTIGGATAGAGNVISGNYRGVYLINADSNVVQGNYIGVDKSGNAALGNYAGVNIQGGQSNVIGVDATNNPADGNVISGNGDYGVGITSYAIDNVVAGNLIGLGADGSTVVGNLLDGGITLYGASGNTIGGTTAAARNIISGNNNVGISIGNDDGTSGNVIEGNYIGTDATGLLAPPNGRPASYNSLAAGIWFLGAGANTVGGTTAGAGNLISGNGVGVYLSDGTTGVQIEGNSIGVTAAGTALGNTQDGVLIAGPSGGFGAVNTGGSTNNTVGGATAAAANLIAFNGAAGVAVVGATTTGNSIEGNSIHDNAGLGIDLGNDGVTPDGPAPRTGPNNLQNYPVLAAVKAGAVTSVSGALNGLPNTTFTLDFYASPSADPSGYGQGQNYLGSASVTTDVTGNATFSVDLAAATVAGEAISATATDPSGDTSEFAADVTAPSLAVSAGGPYSSAEGAGVIFTASASPSGTAYPLTYTWTVNGHTVLGDNGGANPTLTLTWPQLQALGIDDGPNSFALGVAVDDGHGHTATSPATTLSLANTPPTAALGGPSSAVIYQPLAFTFGAADPSATDQAAGFTYAVNWGDATSNTVAGLSGTTLTHDYTAAGNYTVTLTATDKDGGVSTAVTEKVAVVATPQLQNGVLAIPGTAGNDAFTLTPVLNSAGTAYNVKIVRATGDGGAIATFAVPTTGMIEIYGGPGSDSVTLNGTPANDAFTEGKGSVAVRLATGTAATTAFTVGLNGITAVTLKGAGGSDSLTGPNQANIWDITAANAGTLDGSTAFSGFQNLTGGTGADVFSFVGNSASVSGVINGGGGSDTLNFSGRTTAVTVTMAASGPNKATAVTGGWTNIGTVIGSSAATNTLVGANTTNTWDLTGPNAGTLDGALTFSGFQDLTGGSVKDTFAFLPGGSISGALKGVAPTNTLDYSQYGSPVTVDLQTKTATGVGGAWAKIQNFVGAGTTDTLIGANTTNTWSLAGSDAGTVGAVAFAGFANLTGGSGNDTFNFADGAGVTGVIDGGAGVNTLNYTACSTGIYVNLQTLVATGTGGIANIQNVTGGQGNDVLVGNGGNNVLKETGGQNLVIGGGGSDTLIGGGGGDVLIAGSTVYDQNAAALAALLAVWDSSTLSYDLRVADLLSGVTYTDGSGTHTAALDADSTVSQPAGSGPSTLEGGSGLDWFFAAAADVITKKTKGEIVSTL